MDALHFFRSLPGYLQDAAVESLIVMMDQGTSSNIMCGSAPTDDGRTGWMIAISPGATTNPLVEKAIADLVEAAKTHGRVTAEFSGDDFDEDVAS